MERFLVRSTNTNNEEEQQVDDPSDKTDKNLETYWPHLVTYFTVKINPNKKENSFEATCAQCPKHNTVMIYQHTIGNITRHYRSWHPSMLENFKEPIRKGSNRGIQHAGSRDVITRRNTSSTTKHKQLSIGSWATSGLVASKEQCDKLYMDMVIHCMLPLAFSNSPYVKAWLAGAYNRVIIPIEQCQLQQHSCVASRPNMKLICLTYTECLKRLNIFPPLLMGGPQNITALTFWV